ncbi:MAG: PTS transporter subunit EIIC [Lachnospiraceae bacterium]|nr:PTS transporter subunit EIIC [Lachnospiraceae bacterium]
MKDKVFGVLQRVGRSFMLPIAILPVAGLLLGIGGSLTNLTMLETYGLIDIMGPGTILNGIFLVMSDAGDIIFANLPIIFAIGVAIGMAKREKEVAALAAVIAFLIMHASISAMIEINGIESLLSGATTQVVGITSLQMGVFGGIIVGLGVAALHNRFYKIELPQVLSFFGGTRFVPIISALVYTLVGILMYFIWPPIQSGIYAVGDVVVRSGYFGTWVYGLMERLLIPFGLHHVFYLPFWQTAVGGTMEVAGRVVEGAQNIFFAQLADPTVERFAVSATRFMSGKFPLMIFGLPGAALAMYRTARVENRKKVGGLLLSAALTSMLTGITEPIEFTFLFVAPLLYGIHCVFAGLAYMLMHVFEVGVGMTFSGGLIDMFLFGILQGNAKTNWIWIVIVGIFYFIVYYLIFSFLIKKLDLKTPGRGEDEEVKLYTRKDVEERDKMASTENDMVESGGMSPEDMISRDICIGLGGKSNISDIDCCATRLRCTVYDPKLVDDKLLRSTGASGVVHKGEGVQIIYGPKVTVIKSNLEDYMEKSEDEFSNSNDSKKRLLNKIDIYSPLTGRIVPLEQVPDDAFACKALGEGIAIEPTEEYVKAPDDGQVTMIFDTKHALGFLTSTGVYLLIHIGIDTVKLGGKGFETLVTAGDKVKKGTPLMKLDLEYIRANAPSVITPIVCSELLDNEDIELAARGRVSYGEKLFTVCQYSK